MLSNLKDGSPAMTHRQATFLALSYHFIYDQKRERDNRNYFLQTLVYAMLIFMLLLRPTHRALELHQTVVHRHIRHM